MKLSDWQDALTTEPGEPGVYDYKCKPFWMLTELGLTQVPGHMHYFYWTGKDWEYDGYKMDVYRGDKWRGLVK